MSDEFDPFKLGKGLKNIKMLSNSKKISVSQCAPFDFIQIRSLFHF